MNLKNIMLSEGHKALVTVCFHVHEISRKGKNTETERTVLCRAEDVGGKLVQMSMRDLSGGNNSVLKLAYVMMIQLHEFSEMTRPSHGEPRGTQVP
jgi:hypothetical protein